MPKITDSTYYAEMTAALRTGKLGAFVDDTEALPEDQTKWIYWQTLLAFGTFAGLVKTVTASAAVNLEDSDYMLVEIDPNGADRDVNLPAKGNDNHLYLIRNTGAANTLTIKLDAGTSIGTVAFGDVVLCLPSANDDFKLLSGWEKHRTYKAKLSSTYTISASRTWEDVGNSLDLTLPPGKWHLTGTLLGILEKSTSANTAWIKARFYDETAAAEVADSYVQLVYLPVADTNQRRQSGAINAEIELTTTSTIRIEVYLDYGAAGSEPTWVGKYLGSDGNGYSVVHAAEII